MVIPESRADCSRVTHPFATDPQEQAPASPFDLHVLSTPPAFILSQDQTLRKGLVARRPRTPAEPLRDPIRNWIEVERVDLTEGSSTDNPSIQRNLRPAFAGHEVVWHLT